jgi:hypothetical protein
MARPNISGFAAKAAQRLKGSEVGGSSDRVNRRCNASQGDGEASWMRWLRQEGDDTGGG